MESVILVRYEEIFLKGLNKHIFENKLIKNIKKRLADIAIFDVRKSQSRIYIESSDSDFDMQEAIIRLQTIFGIASVSPVTKIDSSFDSIKETSVRMIEDLILRKGYKTFKVEAKRADKSFPLNSPKICAELGAHILKSVPQLKVDVHNPDFIFLLR